MPNERRTPEQVWREMQRGNARFVAGEPQHPRQGVDRRAELAAHQAPHAALFGCSDSRLAAEIIFDKGSGDLFVVRNAGQVISDSVVGSLEYAVAVLKVPLIVVLGHDECGAVSAAAGSPATAEIDVLDVGREHLRDTVGALLTSSELISEEVAAGTLAIVGANYRLREGKVVSDVVVGQL